MPQIKLTSSEKLWGKIPANERNIEPLKCTLAIVQHHVYCITGTDSSVSTNQVYETN